MLNFDQPDARRQAGLAEKQAEHAEELADIEAKIGRVKQLQSMISDSATFEASGATPEKVAAAIEAVRALEAEQGLALLLDRRRQLKQLMETGKLDLGVTPEASL